MGEGGGRGVKNREGERLIKERGRDVYSLLHMPA
jgi:hypothetical protein